MALECIEKKLTLPLNDVFYITPIGDVHADAAAADLRKFDEVLRERLALPNSYFFDLGDGNEWIMPSDHRYRRGNDTMPKNDAVIDRMVEQAIERYSIIPPGQWLGMGSGNHCLKIAQKFGTDPAERVAKALGIPYTRYSGRYFLRVFDTSANKGMRGFLRILWHHGAWGGDTSAGFGGVMKWVRGKPGWDVLCYGHNHQSMERHWNTDEQSTSGYRRNGVQHVMATGCFLRPDIPDQTTYSEKNGYGPVFIGCPLIKCKLTRTGVKVKIEAGEPW